MALKVWRIIDTGYRSAAENMALDDVMLECRARNLIPDTVRFLQFDPPAVLVGYHQVVEHEVRMEFCRSRGIDINRRITGGGAIFFDKQSLGWEVVASKSTVECSQSIEELYRKMCEGPILGLKTLGIKAEFRPKNDIEVNGRKISGTGGTERGNAFLFQGTLLIDFDVATMLRALRIPIMKLKDKEIKSVKERVTCIKWEIGHQPNLKSIKRALKIGFEKALNARFIEGDLTRSEKIFLKDRLGKFQSEKWIFLERRPLNEAAEVYALSKTRGGLIRVSLALDRRYKIIKHALITGDFFVYPSKAILDLEAALKQASCDEIEIRKIVHSFFEKTRVQIPGVTPNDFIKLILEAIGKTSYERLGISPAEANYIHTVAGDAHEILNNGCTVLLLPYCAKLPTCKYRKVNGCVKCGGCSVGKAYELAEKAQMIPITIQSFEHLMATLEELKRQGVTGYVGCCCEAFYCKHQDELEQSGVPGILVDIDSQTCYDLNKEQEALKGAFENQTELKLALLRKLIGGRAASGGYA